jgi:class 3 adenylate cyclase/tetratricopeptide (TPR) repeat protein
MSICPYCGHENEPAAKFCSECGIALMETVRAARAERKILTVLFADLVGFTGRAEQLDPEDVQAVLAPYHERLRYELERWGGTVEKFIGDAVMALFGAPVTREDDPERAVRAALAIRDWIAEEGELQVRIAVNTGEALVNLAARPEAGEGMAAGDVVNTAARLQSAAPVNGILVGETTYRATAETIDYSEAPAVEAKGKEAPIPVWEVLQARARFGVDLIPEARTPLVGRERELDQLVGALGRARQQRSPELITLVGVPGIGKSRLVGELFQSIERGGVLTYWRQGRSLPYGEGGSYWALAEMVKAQAGILETDSEDDVESKLARAVEQLIQEDADWVLLHLRPLVGLASDAPASPEEAFAAWRRFFEALAEQRSIVLVFEDIQWADDGLLDFIEHLVDWVHDAPMLVLCTARLELLERRPAWGGGKVNAATIALSPLTADETATLISALSERPLLPAETQAELLERAGGNPLYAEQYVRMFAEREPGGELHLPETVQGIIAARLDSLPLEEKRLLQDAAVVGKVFWLGMLEASEQQLHALQQKEFVQRARRSSVEGETEYAFKHLLVRDVAYGQIPRAERAEKHRRAAEWIESLGRPEDHAELVAHHYARALELARAAGQEIGPFVDRARVALRDAGDRAAVLNAHAQAAKYYSEALELVDSDDSERFALLFLRGRALFMGVGEGADELEEACEGLEASGDPEGAAEAALMLGDIAWYMGQHDRILDRLDHARSLVAGAAPSRVQVHVLSEASRYEMLADRNDTAVELGRQAIAMAEELGLDDLRAHTLVNVGTARVAGVGDPGGLVELEEGIALATAAKDISGMIRGHNNLGVMHLILGNIDRSLAEVQEAQRIAEHFGHRAFVWFGIGGPLLGHAILAGRWDEGARMVDEFLAEGTAHYQAPVALAWRAVVRIARGDLDGAIGDAERALELSRPANDPQLKQTAAEMVAMVFLSAGDRARASEAFEEGLVGLRELRQIGFPVLWLHGLAWVASVLGRADEVLEAVEHEPSDTPWLRAARAVAVGDFRGAAEIFAGIPSTAFEAFFRLRAAEQFVAEGRRAEADVQLQPALAFYRGVGATRYVREGVALLAASA